MTRLISIGGASSSLQKYEDTIWPLAQDCIRASGVPCEYVEINSAGRSREKLSAALECDRAIVVAKSWGGFETWLELNEQSFYGHRLQLAGFPPFDERVIKLKKFDRLAVIFVDAHGPKWRLTWGWRGQEKIPDAWRGLAEQTRFVSISQFNRKPFGTIFRNADRVHDLTGYTLYPGRENEAPPLVDHFNVAGHSSVRAEIMDALRFVA